MDRTPLGSERSLEALGGLAELIRVDMLSDEAAVAASATDAIVVKTSVPAGREGALLAFACESPDADFTTSPWSIRRLSGANADRAEDRLAGPFKHQVGSIANPFRVPREGPIFVRPDTNVGIVLTNASSTTGITVKGLLYLVTWSETDARDIRRRLEEIELSPPWKRGSLYA